MTKQEIMVTKVGELKDMISCLAIYNGSAKPKKKQSWAFIRESHLCVTGCKWNSIFTHSCY